MRLISAVPALLVLVFMSPGAIFAQSSQSVSAGPVPRLINISGVFRPANGLPAGAVETVTLSIYADAEGGAPIWQETQTIALDRQGRYTLLLGASQADGIPADVFRSGDAHWLGTVFERAGEVEGPRVRITSVPYALRASDADTLGGRPASDYVVAGAGGGSARTSDVGAAATTSMEAAVAASAAVLPGTTGFLAKYANPDDVGPSSVYETGGGLVGVGTTTPFDAVHVRFNNPSGGMTGLAVQNLGSTATSYSGMLFYDQNGALGQFQGFNNVTHEYRINNIARVSPGGAFNGSINFMLGGTSKFMVANNGNIGIGTTTPSALLEVSNALSGGPANMWMTSYTNAVNPYYMARRARGTPAAPTAVLNGDGLAGFYGEGYGTTAFGSGFAGGMTVQAAQNWTDTAHGTQINFSTTANGSTASGTRMVISNSGNVGIGTASPVSNLEVSNALSGTTFGVVTATTFGNNAGASLFVGSKARGTSAAPLPILAGDNLGGFLARGFFAGATSGFSGTRGGMFVMASENWTDTAQGTMLNFSTTPIGTTTPGPRMTIAANGNIGIGTTNPGAPVEIVRNGETTVVGTSFNDDDGSAVFFQRARGTSQAPAAVQAGDALGYFGAGGYGATSFGEGVGAMAVLAAENWTDTAQGTTVAFATTPLTTTGFVPQVAILPNGFVGLGTPGDANGIPTATDRLQVFGDVRVGTAGTDGCIKNFAGTGIVGTCSSDRRLKKNIVPFAPMLDKLTALQPVHYVWRSEEFPNRHFGNGQNYGLIAQDVEQVLPELVTTADDGFKAVDYSGLPLLTIQAVKDLNLEVTDLKSGANALKSENDALKQRVAELERLVKELLTTVPRQ